MGLTTPRYALRYPVSSDADNVPADMLALATDLDNKMGGFSTGTLASRPAAGVTGRRYRATDTGYTYLDIGASWVSDGRPLLDAAQTPLAYNAAWPTSPVNGQEVDRYSDVANTMIWRFRYDSTQAAGSQWVALGSAPLMLGSTFQDQTAPVGSVSIGGGATPWSRLFAWTPGISGMFEVEVLISGIGGATFVGLTWLQSSTTPTSGPGTNSGSPGVLSSGLFSSNAHTLARFSPKIVTAALPYGIYIGAGSAVSVQQFSVAFIRPVKCG